jgi:hypothetical protein
MTVGSSVGTYIEKCSTFRVPMRGLLPPITSEQLWAFNCHFEHNDTTPQDRSALFWDAVE